jgi:UDP-N-acetyl-D-mannosaminuronic acid transferase (WecB/TagA/CpsF family)
MAYRTPVRASSTGWFPQRTNRTITQTTGAIRVSNVLAPDYLWVAPGAPHEQAFVEEITPGLFNIGVIRMSGGLFNFLSRKSRMSSSRGARAIQPIWSPIPPPRARH